MTTILQNPFARKGGTEMAVKIIIKRNISREKEEALRPLLLDLRSLATKQKGYISGETLRNLDNKEEYLVISTWQTIDYWKTWLSSKQRADIQEKIETLLGEKTEYRIYLYA